MRNLGQIIPRGENGWIVRVYAGRQGDKRIYISESVTGSYKKADTRRAEMLVKLGKGELAKPEKTTLQKFAERWLGTKLNLSAKTRRDYEHLLTKHVYPNIGARVFQKVTMLDISTLYGSLISDRELSPRTVRYTHAVLNQVFEYGVLANLIPKNPCHGVELPKAAPSVGDTLTFEETSCLLTSSQDAGDRLHALWRLLLTAGLRPQEALALKWSDLNNGALAIHRALKETEAGKWEPIEETKTAVGRSVVLSEETLSSLSRHRVSQASEILAQGSKYSRADFIFATRTGNHFSPPNIRKWWKAALTAAGVRQVRLYDTRHTNISQELALGATPNEVADRHGHDVVTMMNVYRHKIPGVGQVAPQRVELALAAAARRAKGA